MIEKIKDLPDWVAGFTLTGQITRQDYDTIVLPEVTRIDKEHGHLHFLLELRTGVEQLTAGAWMKDITLGFKNFTHWKKIAIVSDQPAVEKITSAASFLIPGQTKGFSLSQLHEAKTWVGSEN